MAHGSCQGGCSGCSGGCQAGSASSTSGPKQERESCRSCPNRQRCHGKPTVITEDTVRRLAREVAAAVVAEWEASGRL